MYEYYKVAFKVVFDIDFDDLLCMSTILRLPKVVLLAITYV
jgi:hypothetical protein